MTFVPTVETRILSHEPQLYVGRGAGAVFGNDELGQTVDIVSFRILARFGVIFGSVYEADNVGILFNGARFAEVAEHGAFVFARFVLTAELTERKDGYVEFLGQRLE